MFCWRNRWIFNRAQQVDLIFVQDKTLRDYSINSMINRIICPVPMEPGTSRRPAWVTRLRVRVQTSLYFKHKSIADFDQWREHRKSISSDKRTENRIYMIKQDFDNHSTELREWPTMKSSDLCHCHRCLCVHGRRSSNWGADLTKLFISWLWILQD